MPSVLRAPAGLSSRKRALGAARPERFPGASHWVQADAPERVNELLRSFLK